MVGHAVCHGSLVFCLLLDEFGHFELARPAILSTSVVAVAVAFRWQLRRHLWFWGVVAITVAGHALVIVLSKLDNKVDSCCRVDRVYDRRSLRHSGCHIDCQEGRG